MDTYYIKVHAMTHIPQVMLCVLMIRLFPNTSCVQQTAWKPQEVVMLTGVLKNPSCSSLVIPAGQAAAYIWIQTLSVCSSGK